VHWVILRLSHWVNEIPIARLAITQSLNYLTSLCGVCLRQRLQNFLNSNRSVVVLRFLVVE
jgi:hypothetical protein